ncbi:hypothetical protein Tco_0167878 [Tanacetum coccineum]
MGRGGDRVYTDGIQLCVTYARLRGSVCRGRSDDSAWDDVFSMMRVEIRGTVFGGDLVCVGIGVSMTTSETSEVESWSECGCWHSIVREVLVVRYWGEGVVIQLVWEMIYYKELEFGDKWEIFSIEDGGSTLGVSRWFREVCECGHKWLTSGMVSVYMRISFDKSDEDYTVIYDKNSFSYKVIYVDDLKTDSENDNDKVNMPSFPSSEPTVSYFDDLDYFKDFEKEFPAIVYNDALTSKLDFLTKPTESPQHINEFNLKDETSLFECVEEEQNILYFNDLFPYNVMYPDDSKSDKDNDDDKIDIKQSSRLSLMSAELVSNKVGYKEPNELCSCRGITHEGKSYRLCVLNGLDCGYVNLEGHVGDGNNGDLQECVCENCDCDVISSLTRVVAELYGRDRMWIWSRETFLHGGRGRVVLCEVYLLWDWSTTVSVIWSSLLESVDTGGMGRTRGQISGCVRIMCCIITGNGVRGDGSVHAWDDRSDRMWI